MTETRKLTTTVVTDVVAFSRLTAAEEELTLALQALRSDLIDPLIAVYHSGIVKRKGTSIIEFCSVVDAVRCSIDAQNGTVQRNAGLPVEREIPSRPAKRGSARSGQADLWQPSVAHHFVALVAANRITSSADSAGAIGSGCM